MFDHTIYFIGKEEKTVSTYSVAEFEKMSGMRYLSKLIFSDKKTLERIKRRCREVMEKDPERAKRVKWLGAKYSKEYDNQTISDVTIKWIDDDLGFGLFSRRKIKKDEYIGEYTGMVRGVNVFRHYLNEYCFHYPLYGWHYWVYTIDSKMQGNETSFMNHSDEANCSSMVFYREGVFHMGIRAGREIMPGEQLTFNYGKYWSKKLTTP